MLDAIFQAARASNPRLLSKLCDPLGKGDIDTRTICSLTKDHPKWPEFKRNFENGVRVSHVARVREKRAQLNFIFGTEGRTPELMTLIQRDGLWYLLSF